MLKRVVIVGAGPCGLVALKEMRAAGHEAILFEKCAALGGTFASVTAYPDLHLTISNWLMAFSDFPDPERLCYPSADHYLRYLQCYTRHFDLERHITYNAEVASADLGADGRWSLEICRHDLVAASRIDADALIVATGANQMPKEIPSELRGFKGRILNSTEYNEAFKQEVEEKHLRVLVVGMHHELTLFESSMASPDMRCSRADPRTGGGESAAGIAPELGCLSPNVSVWLRHSLCVGPRYVNSKSEMEQVERNKHQDVPANAFLEAGATNRMSAIQNVYAYGFWRRLVWHTSMLNPTLSRMNLQSTAGAFFSSDQATYATKNSRMCEALHGGKIECFVTPGLSTTGNTVTFKMPDGDQEQREFDVVMLCTGFRSSFTWIIY